MIPLNSAPLWSTPRTIFIMNQHDPGSSLVNNSLALTVLYVEKFLPRRKLRIDNRKLLQFSKAIKAYRKRKLKLEISSRN